MEAYGPGKSPHLSLLLSLSSTLYLLFCRSLCTNLDTFCNESEEFVTTNQGTCYTRACIWMYKSDHLIERATQLIGAQDMLNQDSSILFNSFHFTRIFLIKIYIYTSTVTAISKHSGAFLRFSSYLLYRTEYQRVGRSS